MKGLLLGSVLLLLLGSFFVQLTKAEELNAFIIAHSHCDPGWLNTFEGYFRDQVNRILSAVTDQLLADRERRFVWAEISFFQLWYEQQSQEVRENVKSIVASGQLEFVAGGWVQNDEANANFDIVIDQVTEGHDFLNRVFGVVPRVAWQIDPFGHSSLTPSLFARMGFEALVINRIHHNLKASFKESRSMEFLWTGSASLGNESELFTHVLHTHYSAPQGFDWEEMAPQISSHNVASRARDLADVLKRRANAYRTNNLLVPFGDDFKFQNAGYQFENMGQLIKEINSNSQLGVKIKFATVSEYFDAVAASAKKNRVKFPKYSGDFFPYADNEDSYWTGYYTTRPSLKGHSRGTDSILRAAEGMYALGRLVSSNNENHTTNWDRIFHGLRDGRRNAALVQHHDGITGTAKSFVAADYAARLDQARRASHTAMKEMAQIILSDKSTPSLTYDLTTFQFDTGQEVYGIVVHNPLGWVRRKYVKLRVTIKEVVVTSHDGVNLESQVLPVVDVLSLEADVAEFELYFLVEVPPLGTRTYFLAKSTSSKPLPTEFATYTRGFQPQQGPKLTPSSTIQIENEHYEVKFRTDLGLIQSVRNKDRADLEVALNQEIVDYTTSRSGAYIMRPDSQHPVYTENTPIKIVQLNGILVSQVCTYFFTDQNDPSYETSACVRLFSTRGIKSSPNILEVGGFLEVAYSVIGRRNRETVVRFSTNLKTDRIFYTDNGLEIRERKSEGGRTETHYYPNLSLAYLQQADIDVQFTILSRQAMGTHCRAEGMIEQMVHRALSQDDGRGLGEPNNDQSRIEVVVYLVVQPIEPSVRMARRLALALQHQPRLLHTTAPGGHKAWAAQYKPYYYPFVSQLPHNIHLLSFKARDSVTDDIIFRVGNIFEKGQHGTLSQPKEIEWNKIFTDFTFESKRERSLAMSLDVAAAAARKPQFPPSDENLNHASGIAPSFVKQDNQNTEEEGVFISQAALDDKKKQQENPTQRKLKALALIPSEVIVLEPMQIKSYFVQLSSKLAPSKASQITDVKNDNNNNGNDKNNNNDNNNNNNNNNKNSNNNNKNNINNNNNVKPPVNNAQHNQQHNEQHHNDQHNQQHNQQHHQQNNNNIKPPAINNQQNANKNNNNNYVNEGMDDDAPPPPPVFMESQLINAQVSEVEMRAFFGISIVGTGLVILAYVRLRKRNGKGLANGTSTKRVKGLIEL